MIARHLVVHGHFYQPPRENPWTDELAPEPSAAPFPNWNERIAAECYVPNAFARIVDGEGRVVSIVNNYAHLSFDVGPTLLSWLEQHAPGAWARIREADGIAGGSMAQAYFHVILPLAPERDVRTLVRWGLAAFRHHFGRQAEGMWLPETAVNDAVLAVLVEEGVRFTILAPTQVSAVRPIGSAKWETVDEHSVDTSVPYRWCHPARDGRGIDVVVFDGPLSRDVAFEAPPSQALVERALDRPGKGGLVCVATDGETFGHHHDWADRALAYALAVEAPRRGIKVTTAAAYLARHPPRNELAVNESAWSCAHGVGRWRDDCGCVTGGEVGWNQRWRKPLRSALELLRDAVDEVFERRGRTAFADPWRARDEHVSMLIGERSRDDFLVEHARTEDVAEALTLLEVQRHSLAMFTSCGWFFNDLAGLETVLVLEHAARVIDLLRELGEEPPEDAFLDILAEAKSNQPGAGDGRQVWHEQVLPTRVSVERVVALASAAKPGTTTVAGHHVDWHDRGRVERGEVVFEWGHLSVTHPRTGRRGDYAYAVLRSADGSVTGGSRPTGRRDRVALEDLRDAFRSGVPLHDLRRRVRRRFSARFDMGPPSPPPDVVTEDAAALGRALDIAVDRALAAGDDITVDRAAAIARLVRDGGAWSDVERAQERVYAALLAGSRPALRRLAEELGLAVGHLGRPD